MKGNRPKLWVQVLFLLPAMLVFLIAVVVPFFVSCFYSLTDWNGVSDHVQFIGLGNYIDIITGKAQFLGAMRFTVLLALFNIVAVTVVGTIAAVLVTSKIPGRNVVKTILYLPYTMGGMVLGFVWQFIFLRALPFIGEQLNWALFETPWLGYEDTAFFALGIVFIWQNLGYVMVILSAGLITIPKDILEAAQLDGASRVLTFLKIKVPQMVPYVSTCVFWTTACAFKMFELPLSMTKGGPYGSTRTLALNIYYDAFSNNMYGLATAESLIFFLLMTAIMLLQRTATDYLERKWL